MSTLCEGCSGTNANYSYEACGKCWWSTNRKLLLLLYFNRFLILFYLCATEESLATAAELQFDGKFDIVILLFTIRCC